jgi:hypothetical protein
MRASDPHYAKAFNKPNFSRISIKWTGDLIWNTMTLFINLI